MSDSKNKIVINCAGNSELAKDVFAYLLSNLTQIKNTLDDFMTLTVDEIQIVDNENKVTSEVIRENLSQFFESDTKRCMVVELTQLENVFTIGVKTDLLLDVMICEYCGYMSKDYHDMYSHRLVCAFFVSRFWQWFG